MNIVNSDEEKLHIFRVTWGISMKFSGKLCLMIIFKVTKKQGRILTLEIQFSKKHRGKGGGGGGVDWVFNFTTSNMTF